MRVFMDVHHIEVASPEDDIAKAHAAFVEKQRRARRELVKY